MLMRRSRQPPGSLEVAARAAASGDQDAFESLCVALRTDIFRYCWSLVGDEQLAEDATQETFLRATTAIRRFRGDAPVKAWLIVLARRSVGETLRRHRRAADAPLSTAPGVHADHAGVVALNTLIEGLDRDVRAAFVLTQLLGFSYADAAAISECPVGTIRSRVFRARDQLITAHLQQSIRIPTPSEVTDDA